MKLQMSTPYNETFFDGQVDGSLASARAVIPVLLNLLPVPVQSVVDFGCGRGTWLKACLENGVETVLGLDGDYVNPDKLLIDPNLFRATDLKQPTRLDGKFDLALCMEVAEHLPARSARGLVGSLAAAAPVVLFSAAVPGQGGTAHINEQWPPYWQRLFSAHGMHKYDVVRPMIWRDNSIELCYRQNVYVFTKEKYDSLDSLAQFEREFALTLNAMMSKATFGYSSRALKYLAVLHRIHAILSRFT